MSEPICFKIILIKLISSITIIANITIAHGQAVKGQSSRIPKDVNKIFQISCISCHGVNGGRFPKLKLNFERWSSFSTAKEAEKALSICSSMRKGTMPPKTTRISNPELIPTQEQIDVVCKWAESLKSKARKK